MKGKRIKKKTLGKTLIDVVLCSYLLILNQSNHKLYTLNSNSNRAKIYKLYGAHCTGVADRLTFIQIYVLVQHLLLRAKEFLQAIISLWTFWSIQGARSCDLIAVWFLVFLTATISRRPFCGRDIFVCGHAGQVAHRVVECCDFQFQTTNFNWVTNSDYLSVLYFSIVFGFGILIDLGFKWVCKDLSYYSVVVDSLILFIRKR